MAGPSLTHNSEILNFAGLKVLALCAGLLVSPALAQSPEMVGQRYQVLFEDLPPPSAGTGARNPPSIVQRGPEDTLQVPEGFEVNLYASGLAHPRWMTLAPNGDVFLAETREGRITVLRDEDQDGIADRVETFSSGYQRPHGLAFHDGFLYVADLQAVWRVPYVNGALSARGREPITALGALGAANGHWTRNIVFDPSGDYFYVAIGSRTNVNEEPAPRGSIQRFRIDGTEQTTFAGGLRNPVGIAFFPGTSDLFTVVNERDGYGDDLVPDYFTKVEEGAFYGWPYAYLGPHPDPVFGAIRPDLVAATRAPDLLFQAHSAPVGLTFYDGDKFPEVYRNGAFVTHRGSWNSDAPTGYRVAFIPFEDGAPAGDYEVFATGFWRRGLETAEVWGRPAGLLVAADGSLLVADDTSRSIWRITYVGTGSADMENTNPESPEEGE